MSCPNCKIFHSKCKADCCSFVPIDRKIYVENFDKQARHVKELVEMDAIGDFVVPVTEDGKCVFLSSDLNCNIYENRPDVCKKFGNETHINLTCSYQTKNGLKRSKKDFEKIQNIQGEQINKFLQQLNNKK